MFAALESVPAEDLGGITTIAESGVYVNLALDSEEQLAGMHEYLHGIGSLP